jgi:hypothetical protein
MTPQPAPGAGQDKDPAPHVPAPGAGQGDDPAPRVPVPGAGQGDDPAPRVPVPGGAPPTPPTPPAAAGVLTPDWLDDADWQAACASHRDDECPADEDDQDAEWFADPDHGPPPELADLPFEVLAAQIEADAAADVAATARAPRRSPVPAAARPPRSPRVPRSTPGRRTRRCASGPMRRPDRTGRLPG